MYMQHIQSVLARPRKTIARAPATVWWTGISLIIFALVTHFILGANPDADVRFRVDFRPLLFASPAVQIHVAAALSAFLVGFTILLAPKVRSLHRTLGWVWVAAMAVTAGSSFLLTGMMGKSLSPIHGLSAWVLIGLPFGVAAARRKDIRRHRREMTSMYVGGMLIAGLFTFLPGRLMWSLFFVA